MQKKLTAVQWLERQYKLTSGDLFKADFQQALQMEREQMLEASISGSNGDSFEIFYNKTFKP